eukprot:CAMPEP_0175251430 /NCGR_PEP_ID=MMETSP0093-20121207/35659_1 /TAXON_ID=311494 /ORGANISM="Alexandrium monilatum, Strain CCMP3105" /LENGTH=729 /DNA_ID=CAMNT_0016545695 /DNA_START=42 /DNA_END=2231 /DNA_ORIENTATION=+
MELAFQGNLKTASTETTCVCSFVAPSSCITLLSGETPTRPKDKLEQDKGESEEPSEPWFRLAKLWLACVICSGLVPGMSVFVDLFAWAGVFRSSCGGAAAVCDEQYMILSGVFNTASVMTLFGLLPIGLVFDRHGARTCAVGGAGLVCAGLAVLQIPVLGAQAGCDEWTSWLFPVGLLVTDVGALLNSQCMLGAVWHFPNRQSFVISLSNSSYQAASLLPMFLQVLMEHLGLSLASALGVYAAAVAMAACVCLIYTPTQAEFFAEAKRVLGIPLPPANKDLGCWGVLRRGNEVVWRRFDDHRWAIFVSSLGVPFGLLYQSLSGDYGSKLFGSPEAGKRLAQLYAVTNAVIGGAIAPLGIVFIDRLGVQFLLVTVAVLNGGALAFVARPSWDAQTLTCFCSVATLAVFLTFMTKYVLIFAPPNRLGVVQGLLMAYAMLWNLPIVAAFEGWMNALPDGLGRFSLPFTTAAGLGLLGLCITTLRFCLVGFPETPELLPEDEIEIAKPFGCRYLDEVCYVTHTSDRRALLRALAGGDADAVRAFVARIDADRVAEKMANMDADELAELVEAGAEGGAEVEAELQDLYTEEGRADGVGWDGAEEEDSPLAAGRDGCAPGPETHHGASSGGSTCVQASERLRAESERIVGLIRAGDKEAVKEAFLSVSVEDLWSTVVDMEERLNGEQSRVLERDFDRLIPGREFAALLRQRPELKTVVVRLAKRRVRRMVGRRKQ